MKKKALIIDFFGVICSEVAPRWIHARLPGEDPVTLHDTYIRPADKGEVSEEALFQTLAAVAHTTPATVASEWQELIAINEEVVSIIREWKEEQCTALCSNAWSSFIRPLLKKYDLEKLFDVIIISSEVHATKPDSRIFELTLAALEVGPAEALFVDDSPRNITAAAKIGVEGILFTSAAQLRARLDQEKTA